MKIHQSAEDYLETMLILQNEKGYIRSVDIAERLGVTKPSVSYATKKLRESGYINMDANGPISLAPPGLEIATRVYERHQALEKFLILLGVDPQQATEDACLMEHVISNDTYLAVKKYVDEQSE
ncbi:MAG: metal-dependent transcriptional regulator [Clostridiales bacterium]|nr:metal-dependent transcriptional regulator [Clostridiales bacterium]